MSEYKLEQSLGYLAVQAGRAITNEVQRKFSQGGYLATAEHWAILLQLWEEDGLTQGEIAERAGKDEPCVSRLVRNMVDRKLVERKADPLDGRKKRIYLTDETKAVRPELLDLVLEAIAKAKEDICEEELNITKSVLQQVINNLSSESGEETNKQ